MPTKKPTATPRRSLKASSAGQAKKTAAPKSAKRAVAPAEIVPDLTKKYRSHKGDTGSTDIQVIGLSDKIDQLTGHLASHTKDNDSRRGLLMMVGKRRRLLNYLKRQDEGTYTKLIADLGLRK